MIKTKVPFLEGRIFSANHGFLKTFNWLDKNPALQKSHFCFEHVNLLHVNPLITKQYVLDDVGFYPNKNLDVYTTEPAKNNQGFVRKYPIFLAMYFFRLQSFLWRK